jgi:hypothetical protein
MVGFAARKDFDQNFVQTIHARQDNNAPASWPNTASKQQLFLQWCMGGLIEKFIR